MGGRKRSLRGVGGRRRCKGRWVEEGGVKGDGWKKEVLRGMGGRRRC